MGLNALEKLTARPAGRRYTTVAIYRSSSAARSAVTRLYNMGLDMDNVTVVGNGSPDQQPAASAASGSPEPCARASTHEDDESAMREGLIRLGISQENALSYATDIREGRTLVIVHGTLMETGRAAALLEMTSQSGLAEFKD